MIRPGVRFTVAAAALAVLTAMVVTLTATEARLPVGQLAAAAVVLHIGTLFVGSARWLGLSSLLMLGAATVEAGVGDNPSWIRSLAIGALWFVTVEAGWEAIERRSPARRSSAAIVYRLSELATVVGLTLGLGLAATATASLAPIRTVSVQAVVVGTMLVTLVLTVRHFSRSEDTAASVGSTGRGRPESQ